METNIEPKGLRKVIFSLSEEEAYSLQGWLSDALVAQVNTPYASDNVKKVRDAFRAISGQRS